jgi:hypothetical protein
MKPVGRGWRAAGWLIRAAVVTLFWAAGVLVTVVGAVTFADWQALARRGIDATARVRECQFERQSRGKRLRRTTGGYYGCTYEYAAPDGRVHQGYFQSRRQWAADEPVAIRFLADRPDRSATAHDLEHPALVPGGMLALGLGLLTWLAWNWRRGRRQTSP